MSGNDIHSEKDILMFIGSKFEAFKDIINKLCKTENIEFYGSEYSIPLYEEYKTTFSSGYTYTGYKKVYGGGRTDIMYGNDECIAPVELKYKASYTSYEQLKRYINLLKTQGEDRKITGILVCYETTYTLREEEIDDDIYVIELSTGKVY